MNLRKIFRPRRGPLDALMNTGADTLAGGFGAVGFTPRSDGDYHCAERGLYLRFLRPVVTEADEAHATPAEGEFTASGRFVVQRPFGRPVVYVVLSGSGLRTDDVALLVRRTDAEAGSTQHLEFTFAPDSH